MLLHYSIVGRTQFGVGPAARPGVGRASRRKPNPRAVPDGETPTCAQMDLRYYHAPERRPGEEGTGASVAIRPEATPICLCIQGELADEDGRDQHGGQPRESLAKLLKPRNRGDVLDPKDNALCCRDWLGITLSGHSTLFPVAFHWTTTQRTKPICRSGEAHRIGPPRNSLENTERRCTEQRRTFWSSTPRHRRGQSMRRLKRSNDLPEAEAARAWPTIAARTASESYSKEERTRLVHHQTSFADGALSQRCREGGLKAARGVTEKLSALPVTAPDLWIFGDDPVIQDFNQLPKRIPARPSSWIRSGSA